MYFYKFFLTYDNRSVGHGNPYVSGSLIPNNLLHLNLLGVCDGPEVTGHGDCNGCLTQHCSIVKRLFSQERVNLMLREPANEILRTLT